MTVSLLVGMHMPHLDASVRPGFGTKDWRRKKKSDSAFPDCFLSSGLRSNELTGRVAHVN